MADPVVHLTNGVPDSGTGNVTTLGQTLVDGANATHGAIADAAVAAGAAGSFSAKLRSISRDLVANIVLAAGANVIGGVTIADGSAATIGAKADAKSTATDTTAISAMQVWKQISASVQALVSGLITTGSQASPSATYLSVVAAGDVAATASDTGNPLKIGGASSSATPTKVTAGQRVAAWFGLRGEQVCVGATRENKGKQHTTITSSTAETTVVTQIASIFADLYGLMLSNTSASPTNVTVRDGTAGTVIAIVAVPANDVRGFMLPVDSAVPQATVNTNWTVQSSASISSLEVTAYYVKNT